jgi:hypothetical protein
MSILLPSLPRYNPLKISNYSSECFQLTGIPLQLNRIELLPDLLCEARLAPGRNLTVKQAKSPPSWSAQRYLS